MTGFTMCKRLDAAVNRITKDVRGLFELPEVWKEALDSGAKYIILKGGRGSGKTFAAIARLLEKSYLKDFRKAIFLILRELKGSLDGVRDTILDIIDQAGLTEDFTVKRGELINLVTKVRFKFLGARSTGGITQLSQLNKMKGLHNVRIVFGEEAQDLSEETLSVLLPTINRAGQIKVKGVEKKNPPPVEWVFCMNPNKLRDPVIVKVETQSSYKVVHANIFDIEPEFQDAQLIEQAKSEEGQFYYDHVWLGKEFYHFGGAPFATLDTVYSSEEFETFAFLDPSFMGGDYTALSFAANYGGKLILWGYCWREAWNIKRDEIAALLREHNCVSFHYESNCLGSTPDEMFAEVGIDAQPFYSLGNKHARIYRGASYISGRAVLCKNKGNDAYYKNVTEYTSDAANDDAPDSLVSNLLCNGVIEQRKVG